MTNTEWLLVGKAKNGDKHAFALLYEKYYKDLYRFAFCVLKNAHLAEDAVSQAVLKAYERLGNLRKHDAFKGWLFQITSNECQNMFRANSRFDYQPEPMEESTEEVGFENIEIQEILFSLSDEERLIVNLSVFAGYNSKEIAKILHKKEGSVRSIKSRCFARLREEITL